ncbi:NRDE family protein [Aspergillus undulatus]|uniref:NRDE family protein n=1 Tax=Aspergillus undulatus TaxID=1810928 RepID=UPI003CCDE5BD
MCIALISTAHPSYSLIIINNRDEYLLRPTAPATYWPSPNTHILGGRDLARKTQGTWMGITTSGKIAVLTNYRERTADAATGNQSRGAIVNSWLMRPETETCSNRDEMIGYVGEMVGSPTARNVGGFSLVCGYVGNKGKDGKGDGEREPLAVVSNRSSRMEQVEWIAGEESASESGERGTKAGTGKTVGLSNTVFDDRSWPKILDGERMVEDEIAGHTKAGEDEEELIQRLLGVLNTNSLPQLDRDATAEDYLPYFRRSIFIPLIGTREKKGPATAGEIPAPETKQSSCVEGHGHGSANGTDNDILDQSYLHGPYGTQKQTIILVSKDDRVRYFERTLYDGEAKPVPIGEGDRSFEFQVTR